MSGRDVLLVALALLSPPLVLAGKGTNSVRETGADPPAIKAPATPVRRANTPRIDVSATPFMGAGTLPQRNDLPLISSHPMLSPLRKAISGAI